MQIIIFQYLNEQFGDSVLLTNSWAEHLFLSKQEYSTFENNPKKCSNDVLSLLKARFFICENSDIEKCQKIIDIKYRTKRSYLENETLLLLVIPTIIISRKSGQKIQKIANLQYYKSKANYGTKKKGISR